MRSIACCVLLFVCGVVWGGEQVPILVKDCIPGASGSLPNYFAVAGNTLYFFAPEADGQPVKLWKTTGLDTVVQVPLPSGFSIAAGPFVRLGTSTIFWATTPASGTEPWSLHETLGLVQLKDLTPGAGSSYYYAGAKAGNTYFFANRQNSVSALWKTDGTPAGTILVKEFDPEEYGYQDFVGKMIGVGNTVYFHFVYNMWKSDGTTAGTIDLGMDWMANYANYFSFNGNLWAWGYDSYYDESTFVKYSNNSTSIVKELIVEPSVAGFRQPQFVGTVGNKIVFFAPRNQPGTEMDLWSIDGTTGATTMVQVMRYDPVWPVPSEPQAVEHNGLLYFVAANQFTGMELWCTNGTAGNLILTKDIKPSTGDAQIAQLTASGDGVYFRANDGVNGWELWKTDGSQSGTKMIDVSPSTNSNPEWLTNVNNVLYLSAYRPDVGNELFRLGYVLPVPPNIVSAQVFDGVNVGVSWSDVSTGETGFRIERKAGAGGTWSEIFVTAPNAIYYPDPGLTPGTTYYYRIRTQDSVGLSAYSNETSVTTASAPAAPSGLARTVVSASQINLTWVDNSNNETGFKLEYKIGAGGTYSLRANLGAGVTSYSDTGLTQNTQYYYRVRATNIVGDSANSNEVNGTTMTLPAAPTTLAVSTVSVSQINLTWTDTANNETGFKIERKTGSGGTYSQVGTVGQNVTSYSSTGLAAGTQYYFRVRAYNTGGNSGYTNEANATTFAPPVAPGSLTATLSGLSQINLAWADNSTNETTFKVERKLGAGGTYEAIVILNANVTSYADTNLPPGRQYYYRVRATNINGDSVASNEANASTPVPEIAVYTVDAFAYEGAAPAGEDRTGKWVIARTGLLTDAVTVYFRLGGPAKLSTNDYTLSSPNGTMSTPVDGPALTSITIPAQSSSVAIILTPLADSVNDPNEAPQITLVADQGGSRYSLGSSITGGIGITDAAAGSGPGQPVVSVWTVDGEAYEALTTPETYQTRRGSVKFTRSGSTSGSLTVNYSLSTSSAAATDYTAGRVDGAQHFNNRVVFAPGQSEVEVFVDPVLDTLATELAVETVQYTITSGSYIIGLGSSQATVSIYNLPISSFTVNPNPATVNSGVQLLLQTPVAGNHQYFWNFGDSVAYPGGNVQTSTNTVNHVYTSPGTYTVRGWFVVNNYRHVATATLVVTSSLAARSVNQAPTILSAPWVVPNPATVAVPSTANVVAIDPDKGPQPLTYTWSKVDGPGAVTFEPNGTAESASSQTTFSAAGTYTVRVSVSDGQDSAESEVKVIVQPAPAPKKEPDSSF